MIEASRQNSNPRDAKALELIDLKLASWPPGTETIFVEHCCIVSYRGPSTVFKSPYFQLMCWIFYTCCSKNLKKQWNIRNASLIRLAFPSKRFQDGCLYDHYDEYNVTEARGMGIFEAEFCISERVLLKFRSRVQELQGYSFSNEPE